MALKIIKLGMDTRQVIARFEAERQALALMDHPNIARVLDGGATATGRPYFVMELVQGVPITEFCDKSKLTAQERLKLFIPVCQAIQSAHQKGIIHRDIKPSNVLVTLHDGQPLPMVIDFGIAKAVNQKLTEKTLFTNYATMIGTPAYMSPEQAEMSSMDVDTRADLYSLGVLLYELLTGTTPFPEKRLRSLGYGEMQRVIIEEEPERPSTRLSTMADEQKATVVKNRGEGLAALGDLFKGDLDWVVMKCLEKDRTRRYESASGLAADIQRHLANEPVTARPPSLTYRLNKAIRRNKGAFAAAAVIAATLILGITLSVWQAVRATHAERRQAKLTEQAERAATREAMARQSAVSAQAEAERVASRLREETYAADMRIAQTALDSGNLRLCREKLLKHKPQPGEARSRDLRGIEWRYLWEASRSQALAQFGPLPDATSAAMSPNGQLVAAGFKAGGVVVWDQDGGKLFEEAAGGMRNPARTVAFSPDGTRLIYCSSNCVRIISTQSWRLLWSFPGEFVALGLSADGNLLAAVGEGRAAAWRLDDPDPATTLWELPDTGTFAPALLNPTVECGVDGSRLFVADRGRGVFVWDAQSKKFVVKLTDLLGIKSLVVSPNGKLLAAGSWDGHIALWSLPDTKLLLTQRVAPSYVWGLAFAPDAKTLATGGSDQQIKIWRLPDAAPSSLWPALQAEGELQGHTETIRSLSFTGGKLISSGDDGVGIWPVTAPPLKLHNVRGPAGFNEGPYSVLGLSADATRLWLFSVEKGLFGWKYQSRDGVPMPSPWPSGLVRVQSLEELELFEASGRMTWVRGSLYYRSLDGWMCKFDPETRADTRLFKCESTNVAPYAIVDHLGRPFLITVSRDLSPGPGRHGVWDIETNAPATGPWVENLTNARTADFGQWTCILGSPDGAWIAQAEEHASIGIWDVRGQRRMPQIAGPSRFLYHFAFSPDSRLLASGSWEPAVRVWNVETGELALPPLRGSFTGINYLVFSVDGRTLVGSDDDSTTRMWSVASGQEMVVIQRACLIETKEPHQRMGDGLLLWLGSLNRGRPAYVPLPTTAKIDAEIQSRASRN